MRCNKCGTESTTGKKFCAACGSPLSSRCPKCGAENAPSSAFCEDCGSALAGNAAPAASGSSQTTSKAPEIRVTPEQPAASTAIDGERKTVTALFADIKGSTELMEELDPEEARAIVDPALNLMIDAVHRYDGYIVQSTGDGIFALFGAPVAHEDHPQRALYAALRMQDEIRRYADRQRAEGRAPIQIRVGVNTGEVVVRSITTGAGQVEYTSIGHTTNLASRMQTLANPGSTVIAESTRKLVEGYFALKPLGGTKVKGVTEPVNVYEVTGLGPLRTRLQRSAGRGLTKFVGREREMEALKHAAEQAKSGHGQIVAAMAEPGVGKSRLFFEFKARSAAGWMVLETFSVSHGKASAFLPVIDLLRNYFRIANEDDERSRREKVAGKIAILDRSLEDKLPYLFNLLGIVEGEDSLAQMDGQIRKRRMLEAIKRILLRESLNQPLIVIFEDLHWIDEETQMLLNLLADSIGTAKFLLLVNYRPEYLHQWGNKTYYTQLRLDPLGKESAGEMLTALLGDGKDLVPLKLLVIERTEGTPFFMEEMVQALFEDGVLGRNGAVKLVKAMSAVKVPATVQAILASRIDRLPTDEKELLQTLAVIGREFALSLARRMVDGKKDDDLERALADLQMAEFIYEQPATGDIEYVFKHGLTQEVAYNSLLIERRKQLHERVGVALESMFVVQLEDHLDELAYHYGRSGNLDKAIEYLKLAGERAYRRSDLNEAAGHQERALELIASRTAADAIRLRAEPELLLAYGTTLSDLGRYGDAMAYLERALELGESARDEPMSMQVLSALRLLVLTARGPRDALPIAERLLELTARSANPDHAALGHSSVGGVLYYLCELLPALRHFQRVIELGASPSIPAGKRLADPTTRALAYSALTLWQLGYPDQASEWVKKSLAAADSDDTAASDKIWSYYRACLVDRWLGNIAVVKDRARKTNETAADKGFSAHGLSLVIEGWALAASGQSRKGIDQIKRGVAEWRGSGGAMFGELFEPLADACLRGAEFEEGLRAVSDGLDVVERSGEVLYEAELYRLRGELLFTRNSGDWGAEAALRTATEIACRCGSKSWELRASTSLARLLAKQGRRDEARTMLADIYGWFTEGFDTADLKEAKTLLEELRG
jgi:class 3 adenylate cyclase/tetratricopeptide (TPR) repeat protein